MTPRVVYSPHFNIGFLGLERLHPFDSRKYGRAWRCLRTHFGRPLRQFWVRPTRPISRPELLSIHTEAYLHRLRQPQYVARALEVPALWRVPGWLIDWIVLRPMRWATMGTIVAARECLQHGFAVNLSGGYHHAKADRGEGFSIYADVALAVHMLRSERLLASEDRIAYIDLDAHQGNGVCHLFMSDRSFFIFDMYNSGIYPAYDTEARSRIDCNIGLRSGCHERDYLDELKRRLPGFLDSIDRSAPVRLAIFNAGTDVYVDDPLGNLRLSAESILARDVFVVDECRKRAIPTLMVLSGGYTPASYRLVADSVIRLVEMQAK